MTIFPFTFCLATTILTRLPESTRQDRCAPFGRTHCFPGAGVASQATDHVDNLGGEGFGPPTYWV